MENPPSNPHGNPCEISIQPPRWILLLQVMGQEKNAALHGWAERALAPLGGRRIGGPKGGPEGVD
jgi:hypothetical protein